MFSPSSSMSKRSTPCVDGCCGPMLSTMLRRVDVWGASFSISTAILNPRPGYGSIFAQRMAFPIFGHHDADEIGMVEELHAEQVERLALIPVGGAPDGSDGFDHRV